MITAPPAEIWGINSVLRIGNLRSVEIVNEEGRILSLSIVLIKYASKPNKVRRIITKTAKNKDR
jgi:hypothetical protein